MQIAVLGAGLIGKTIAQDLAREAGFAVTAIDRDAAALAKVTAAAPVQGITADLRALATFDQLLAGFDLVVCAVPGFMGFETLRKIIAAGKTVVDISFFAEDPYALDELARARNVTAVVDCGVAPGLGNIIAGQMQARLDTMERYVCYVGGLPQVRTWPFAYKAVFSPRDVIEEYVRPARYVEHGVEVVRPALSDVELLDFPGVGTLEAFNTDGLRTLRHTLDAPFMIEKTLRYPGHADLMRVFRESGFFAPDPITVDGQAVSPLAVTSALLFDQWRLQPGETDLTVFQVQVEGTKDGRRVRHTFDLLDRFDEATGTTSMARTTGYTCAIVARLVADGRFARPGICPPELVGADSACYDFVMAESRARGVKVVETIETLTDDAAAVAAA